MALTLSRTPDTIASADNPPRHLLVRACLGEEVERVPVWAMRQAGRWDPEFQKLRAGLDFYSFSENAELAARASLCPRRFGVDGIILFYDITTLAVAMGQPFRLEPERGPVPERPIRDRADVDALTALPDPDSYRHVLELLRLVRAELAGSLPVLVFAGAPFTLATYQIGTGKQLDATRLYIHEQPTVWRALLEKTTAATTAFLRSLLQAGADVYQIFDSWAGALDPSEYDQFAQHYHQRIFSEVGETSILFVKDCAYLERMASSGAKVVSLGTRHNLAQALADFPQVCFQGNVDHMLLVNGKPDQVAQATRACLAAGGGQRHVLNLDHGMDRLARVENFEAYIHAATSRQTSTT